MRITHNDINKEISKELGVELETVKSISDFLFSGIKEWVGEPDSLILNIRGIGKFYHSKKKVMERKKRITDREEFLPYETEEGRKKLLDKYNFLLDEYEKYLEKKYKYRNGDYT